MASRTNVRQHTRTTRTGKRVRVRKHTRRALVSPGHAWGLFRRALRAGRRKRRITAAVLGGLAVVELGAWLTLSGTALILATFAVLAGAVACSAAVLSGMPAPTSGRGKVQARTRRPPPAPARKAPAARQAPAHRKVPGDGA